MQEDTEKVILPLKESLTKAWPENNFLNALVQTMDTGYDWLMNTHIQTYGSVYRNQTYDIFEGRVTFYPFGMLRANIYDLCPFIRKYNIPRKYVLENYSKFSDFLVKSIQKRFYICTRIYQHFLKDDLRVHPCYFFGYDLIEKKFWTADNYENGKYKTKILSFQDVDKAFDEAKEYGWDAGVFLYEMQDYHFENNVTFIADQVEDYLLSGKGMCYLNRFYCPSPKYKNEDEEGQVVLGLASYQILFDQIEPLKEGKSSSGNLDFRSFVFLRDHKKMMLLRNRYLEEKGVLPSDSGLQEQVDKLYRSTSQFLYMLLKFNAKPEEDQYKKCRSKLEEIRYLDEEYMKHLLNVLRR